MNLFQGTNFMKQKKSRFLNHTKYIASAFEKTVHSTIHPCEKAYLINPDERWYLNDVPSRGGYYLCEDCFPH
jgi:hypothetical protein